MKKLITTFTLVMAIALVFGQRQTKEITGKTIESKAPIGISKIEKSNEKSASRWFHYYQSAMGYMGIATRPGDIQYLFPDSSISILYSDGTIGDPFIHQIVDMIDVTSNYWNDPVNAEGELILKSNSTFQLDTVEINCLYQRNHTNTSIVDTLQFDIVVNNPGTYVPWPLVQEPEQPYGVDTVIYMDVLYSYANNNMNNPGKVTVKIPLTAAVAADTTDNGILTIQIPTTSLPISTFKLITSAFKFIPGYSYSLTDTLNNKNNFMFISHEENDGGYMSSYVKRDYNTSFVLPTDVRYDKDLQGWNGFYCPTYTYTAPFAYEHHYIRYKITGLTNFSQVGVSEISNDYNISYGPNPASNELKVELNSNGTSTISIFNLVGQNVKEIYTNNAIETLNVSNLKAGIYMLKVTQGTKVFTGKVIIN